VAAAAARRGQLPRPGPGPGLGGHDRDRDCDRDRYSGTSWGLCSSAGGSSVGTEFTESHLGQPPGSSFVGTQAAAGRRRQHAMNILFPQFYLQEFLSQVMSGIYYH
jgi:hypothetical protein